MRRMLGTTRVGRHTFEGMAADMTTPRLSGPCTHGHHDYCLGPRMLLPCNCHCHEHQEPEGTLNKAGFSIDHH